MGERGDEGFWGFVWRSLLGKPPRVDPNVLVASRLPVAASSAALRSRCAAHGVEVPERRTVFVRADAEVCGFEVPSAAALPTWQRLHAVAGRTGLSPLVFRAPVGLDAGWLAALARTTVRDALAAAANVDAVGWLAAAAAQHAEWLASASASRAMATNVAADAAKPLRLLVPYGDDERPVPGVFVLLLPTPDAAEFPAFLDWGDHNGNPQPAAHVALLRSWRDRFGAVPAAAQMDRLEFVVERPPASLAAARALTREHACYCEELLDDLDGYAAAMVGARTWYFWWD